MTAWLVIMMAEFLVILNKDADAAHFNAVVSAIGSFGGKVTLQYPFRLIIGQDGTELLNKLSEMKGVSIHTGPVEKPESLSLDEAALLAVQGWNLRTRKSYLAAKARRADDGAPWDSHDPRMGGDVEPVEESRAPFAMAGLSTRPVPDNTSMYMIGTVAVGVVIVEGPSGSSAEFTEDERRLLLAELQEGANILINMAPAGAKLNFIFDVNHVKLNLDPKKVQSSLAGENKWRDQAMSSLGFSAGSSGMYDYINMMRTAKWPGMFPGPDWGYIAFLTKYPARHFAYASLGGPRLVIQYGNDDWGPSQIDRVFAHETGHIFHAPDEYANSKCSLGGSYGYLKVPNDNCENDNPSTVPCIMSHNTPAVCKWTVGHFGWQDTDGDGVPDPIDPLPGTYRADVGITAGDPFWNNADVWIRNQDDGESNQSHQNPRSNVDNFIYARVQNFAGVRAEIVRTRFYLASYAGTEFVYPDDYTNPVVPGDTISPTIFSLDPGEEAITKVHLDPGHIPPASWHTCILVHVDSAQDLVVPSGSHVWDSNNLAQKNLVIDYISPSQTLLIPIILQNITSKNPFFEMKRMDAQRDVKVKMLFKNLKLKPTIIAGKTGAKTVDVGTVSLTEGSETGVGKSRVSLQFPHGTEMSLHISGEQELSLRLAAGSAINLGSNLEAESSELKTEALSAKPIQRFDRIVLPMSAGPSTKFKFDLKAKTHEFAGFSITAPATARPGTRYKYRLVQYNENGNAVGGIDFVVQVVSRLTLLKENQWRIEMLRELGRKLRDEKLNLLADAADALIAIHISSATGNAADATDARLNLYEMINQIVRSEIWGYPVSSLAEMAARLKNAPDIVSDVDALLSLLFYAEERLLKEQVKS